MPGLVDARQIDRASISRHLDRARSLREGDPPLAAPTCVALVFAEPSTRTRVAFAQAVARLGGRALHVDAAGSSLAKGEGMEETIRVLGALEVDGVVLRTPVDGLPADLAAAGLGPWLVNAGDGRGQHPTQALGDTLTILAAGLEPEGLKVAMVGDLTGSRVAHSLLDLWPRLGVDLRVLPCGPWEGQAERLQDMGEATAWAEVVYALRPQTERWSERRRAVWSGDEGAAGPDEVAKGDYFARFGVASLAPGQRLMAPGPCWPGVDVAPSLLFADQSLVLDQVTWGMYGRMALMEGLAS